MKKISRFDYDLCFGVWRQGLVSSTEEQIQGGEKSTDMACQIVGTL